MSRVSRRRTAVGAVVLGVVGGSSAGIALAAGTALTDSLIVAGCVTAGCASLVMASGGDGVHWPQRLGTDRTSAGWHEVRILAETLDRGGSDSGLRRVVLTRIRIALGLPTAGQAAVTRRDYDRALAELRHHSRRHVHSGAAE